MSSFGTSDIPMGSGSIPDVGSNAYNFSTGLGSIDPNSGLNSLGGGLMGANAGTLPNGFATAGGASSNFLPSGDTGISNGSLNGNLSFSMPGNSMGQLDSQSLQNGLAAGAKLATGDNSQKPLPTGSGKVSLKAQNFSSPIADFAGSAGGSKIGSSLLQLLQKYRPGVQ